MPLKMNHSASFVVSNNCLDKCPKCGQNVCEHTSVADAINLKNSVSQDFSTYSSDSSLAKQLFNEPSNALVNYNNNNNKNNKCNRISLSAINRLNESFFINQYQKQQQYLKNFKECQCNQKQMCYNNNNSSDNQYNFMPCFTVRPLSCQVMIIDNETTDKLLKDFFDASSTTSQVPCNHYNHYKTITTPTIPHRYSSIMPGNSSVEVENQDDQENTHKPWHSSPKNEISTNNSIKLVDDLNKLNKAKEKSQKKKKFSNFRLFLKNSSLNKSENKSSPSKKAILKSSGLVNCLTSSTSSSSSSCEELRHKLFKNKKSTKTKANNSANNNNNNNTNSIKRQISGDTDNEHTVLYEEESTTTDHSNSTLKFAPNEINKELQNNDSKLSQCKSIMSLTNTKTLHDTFKEEEEQEQTEEDKNDNSDYNQMQNIELCPIVVSDIDEYQEEANTSNKKPKSEKNSNSAHFTNCNNNYNSNNFNNNNIINNNNNTTNINNISTIISVPLNNYLFYNYEKRNNDQKTKSSSSKIFNNNKNNNKKNSSSSSSGGGNYTDSGMESTNGLENSNSFNTIKTSNSFSDKIYATKPEIINSEKIINSQNCYSALRTNETSMLKKNRRREPISKNRLSYFSNCSTTTCQEEEEEESSTSSSTTFDDSTTKTEFLSENLLDTSNSNEFDHMSSSHKYHSISIIFIIMGLFSVNFFQEYFVLFYYFNTEQFYWLVYSMIGMFSGQTLTLILSLLTEIDFISLSQYNKVSKKNPAVNNVFSTSSSISTKSNEDTLLASSSAATTTVATAEIMKHKENKANVYNQNLYLIFKNPFSKLFLLIPGYLPISVYIQFFKHVFNYRKSSGNQRFKSEFQLSLYLFYNGIFHSLPLAIINACYFTSITTTYSLTSYYTDLLSLFSMTSSSPSSSSTAIFVDDLNLERRNQLVLILVSIFVSIAIGICLFTTYFELMKQMNYLSFLKLKSGIYQYMGLSMFSSSNPKFNKKTNKNDIEKDNDNDFQQQQQNNLGLIEILVYFCYKFCLIISRLAIIGLFWYMFREWLVIVVLAHILFSYLIICISKCGKKRKKHDEKMLKTNLKDFNNLIVNSSLSSSSSNEQVSKSEQTIFKNKRSKLSKHLTLFIICLLSCIDLFMNQLSEIYHIRKVVVYYVLYFIQNFSVLTYWLIKSIMNARIQYEKDSSNTSTTNSNNKNFVFILKSLTTVSSSLSSSSNLKSEIFNFTPTQYACYATLIYLFICLFTIFGLILKFLHLHILRKRYNIR
jgi:hypothetical protein